MVSPNYFTEQRFGRDGHNLTQAIRWAKGRLRSKIVKNAVFTFQQPRSEILI